MSNETKWTKGPWAVKALKNGIEHEIKRDGYFVATVHGSCVGEAKIGANAHLIAAAPELYSELCKARHEIQILISEGYMGYVDLRSSIDAALAKSRGEQS